MKRPAGSQHTISFLSRSLKKVGRSVGRKKPGAIARQVMAHPKIRKAIVKVMGKVIREDFAARKHLQCYGSDPRRL